MTRPDLFRLALCALLPALIGGSTLAQPTEPAVNRGTSATLRRCINTTFVTNWTPYDDHTILVQSGGQSFKLTTNRCSGLTSPLPQIDTELRGGSTICSPHDVQLMVSSSGLTPIPCFVQSIQPLTPEEARSMEAAGRKSRK